MNRLTLGLPRLQLLLVFLATVCMTAAVSLSAEISDAQKLYKSGKYAECVDACKSAIDGGTWDEDWFVLKIRAEMTIGRYADAQKTLDAGLDRESRGIQLRLIGYDVLRANNHPNDASDLLDSIRSLVQSSPRRYTDCNDRLALGRALLIAGADARQVLELVYDTAKKENPKAAEPYIASGDLALNKSDFAIAAESFQQAAKLDADNPDIFLGLARSYDNDAERATAALTKALELNPNHVSSLLFQADNLIDQEDYPNAQKILTQVLTISPKNPIALAYQAVLAHLSGDRKKEQANRTEALSTFKTNPEVDHLIGKKISQKYRFSEGEKYQRESLKFSPTYEPAKVQLCQDLLRLGKEDEGWALADEVFKEDPYNVEAYNLTTLHDNIAKFRVLKNHEFLVRLDDREEQIYGQRVMDLLERARQKLCDKYDVKLPETVTVEVFPQQKDFAIRTFGMPGGAGYLGVCFGSVVTVNSPASRVATPANWEAVVWHEFCHVVTLNKTENKMPRWLSEGISVYEERQENPSWGQAMTPEYREMILADKSTPVSKLSGAFLKPPGAMELQFAYFESSMVVKYVVDRFGMDALKKVLSDLADDVPINDALAKRTEPIEKLDESFSKWFHDQATQLASGADLKRPELELDADSAALAAWNKDHPNSFWGLLGEGQALLAEQKFEAAKAPLEKAIALYPNYAQIGGPYVLLAAVNRGLGNVQAERAMLEKHVSLNSDAIEPRLRLIEIDAKQNDWKAVKEVSEQILAINPLIPSPHRNLSQAAEMIGDRASAIAARRVLLFMDPLDLADNHYRLAKLLADDNQLAEARKEVVRSLEEAPRFRDAHKLLLEIVTKTEPANGGGVVK